MRIKEIIEGRFDPYQNKAIFFAGVPGAGKTFIARRLASIFYGLKQVNPDIAFKYLLKKANLSVKMPPEEEYFRDRMRQHGKQVAGKTQQIYQREKLGMLIDTTGRSYPTIDNLKKELEADDYTTAMIYVDADIETSVKRNRARERSIPEKVLLSNFGAVKANVPRFRELFGDRFFEIDNSYAEQPRLPQALKDLESNVKQFLNK